MKKYLCLVIALLLLLSACGRKAESKPAGDQPAQPAEVPDDAAPTNPEPAPEEEQPGEPVQNEVKEPEPHHPYEWLGLSGMPECNYFDILSTNHYYQVYDTYSLGTKAEVIEAADGIDAYQKTTVQLLAAGLVMVPYLLLSGGFSGVEFNTLSLFLLLVLGIVHTGFAYALYFGSMDGLKVQSIAVFSYIDPVSALLFSALLLREPLTVMNAIGAVMIIGAALASEMQQPEN